MRNSCSTYRFLVLSLVAYLFSWAPGHSYVQAKNLAVNPGLEVLSADPKTSNTELLSGKTNDAQELHPKLGRFIAEALTADFYTSDEKKKTGHQNQVKFKPTAFTRIREGDEVQIYVELSAIDEYEVTSLKDAGLKIEIVNEQLQKVQGWANPSALRSTLDLHFVSRVTAPLYAISHKGSVTTEGDEILQANELRELGITGKGVKVGILSDGANDWRDAAATGDLPQSITRFGSCSTAATSADPENCIPGLSGTCNEGTAMAEIIHDIAPDAELAVASVASSLEFIERAEQLAYEFGADIIVDDLGFLGEPFYEDGEIALALDALPDDVLLVSSAGNNAAVHHEDRLDFRRISGAVIPGYHDFHPNNGDDPFHGFIVPARTGTRVIMQWNEPGRPYDNSANNHSMQLYDLTDYLGETSYDNRGDYAFETLCAYNPSNEDDVRFLLLPLPGNHRDFNGNFTLFFLGSGPIEYPIARGSIVGHAALERVLAVGAINAEEPGNGNITFYSSQGPSEIVKVGSGQRTFRKKPDVIGIDGVAVSGTGRFSPRFFGTSAAAPHVAGIAALLKSVPFAKIENVREAILDGAVDLGAQGFDPVYGNGRIDALLAREALQVGNPLPAIFLILSEPESL